MNTQINLYIADMTTSDNTSGVDRYINCLINGLQKYQYINIHWIHFIYDPQQIFPKEELINTYIKYNIPLPQQYNSIISKRYWMRKYNEQVYRLVKYMFEDKDNCIFHLNTLNLIDLAVLFQERLGCKIITHLHCIPWKNLYNTDKNRFNKLYNLFYHQSNGLKQLSSDQFVTNNCELQSYVAPDALICVTHCAVNFLNTCINNYCDNMYVIPNGINDFSHGSEIRLSKTIYDEFHCLYVGVINESKGINYILKAVEKVQSMGYRIKLTIAGKYNSSFPLFLQNCYPHLNLDLKGRISFDELKDLYSVCDIGLIASLQEQASYVAIEMAMFGLPIIMTAVDGLDEIFTDEVNALKVNTRFSPIFGLSVDVDMMTKQIIRLIHNHSLRESLSINARQLYLDELNLELMVNRTVEVYKQLIK